MMNGTQPMTSTTAASIAEKIKARQAAKVAADKAAQEKTLPPAVKSKRGRPAKAKPDGKPGIADAKTVKTIKETVEARVEELQANRHVAVVHADAPSAQAHGAVKVAHEPAKPAMHTHTPATPLPAPAKHTRKEKFNKDTHTLIVVHIPKTAELGLFEAATHMGQALERDGRENLINAYIRHKVLELCVRASHVNVNPK